MNKEPDIVKELKNMEKQGTLDNYSSGSINVFESSKKENTKENKKEENNNKINNFEDGSNDINTLQNENQNLKKKVEELKNRYDSITEYFEIISDTTIALGQKDLFSDVNDIIFQLTPDGRITYINSAVQQIANYDSYDLIGRNIFDIIPKNDWLQIKKNLFPRFKKKTQDKELNSFESTIIKKNGESLPVEINGKLIKHNVEVIGRKNEVRIQGSIRDITERRKAEKERIEHAEELEAMNQQLEAMNEELNATNEELLSAQEDLEDLNKDLEKKVIERTQKIEKLLKHKDEFIGQLGHDLKSPLTPLVGLLPTIEKEEKDPKLKELLTIANRNVSYMRDIVTKTLQLERLNSPNNKAILFDVNLNDLINELIESKKTVFAKKNITVENNLKKELLISCDKIQFKELIDNLLTNALKFSDENGKIFVDSQIKDGNIILSVKDTGIGMTKDQIDKVFDEFYKVDPSRHDLESSGLGLSICKRIVELHNGKIWVESPGLKMGTTFFVSIPLDLKTN